MKKKRILSILLAALLVCSLLPVSAFAETNPATYAVTNGTPEGDSAKNHGYITIGEATAAEGDSVTVTVKPDEGYLLKSLTYVRKPSEWSVVGDFSDKAWEEDIPMVETTPDIFVSPVLTFSKDTEFKVRKDAAWTENYGAKGSQKYTISDGEQVVAAQDGANIIVPKDGNYIVTLNVNSTYIMLTEASAPSPADAVELTAEKDGTYTFAMPAGEVILSAEFEELPDVDETLYWGYDDSTKTLYLSKTAGAITDKGPTPGSFDPTVDYSPDDVFLPWDYDELYKSVEYVEILNDIVPGNTADWFHAMSELKEIKGIEHLYTGNVTSMKAMFSNCGSLTTLDLSRFDTSKVTNMYAMFANCQAFESLDVRSFDTSNVTDMSNMFELCKSLKTFDLSSFDTSKVESFYMMFEDCRSLESVDVSGFDTSAATNISHMFYYCYALKTVDVSGFDTSNVTDMNSMFFNCNALETVDVSGFDTSKVTYTGHMFYNCNALETVDVSKFDTSKVKNMASMFDGCLSLTSLDVSKFNTSNVESMKYMFADCRALTSLDLSSFVTTQVQTIEDMFYNCTSLKTLDLSNFDCANVNSASDMLYVKIRSIRPSGGLQVITNSAITQLKTPKNLNANASLPAIAAPMKWYYADTLTEYEDSNLPKASDSKTLIAGILVDSWTSLQEAINNTPGDATTPASGTYTLILKNNVTAPDDVTSITIPEGKDIGIDLNGHVLNANGKCRVITVEEGGKLTVIDSLPETEYKGYIDADGLWHLAADGHPTEGETEKNLTGGIITGGVAPIRTITGSTYSNGGGVYNEGTFVMYGGNIAGNTNGQAFTNCGGGVYNDGTFTMYDGNIISNVLSSEKSKTMGGGVYICDGRAFTMKNGTISSNRADIGGGVFISSSGTFTMEDGKITGNTSATYGGGVYNIGRQNATFRMKGGEISGNTAVADCGGGIHTSMPTSKIYLTADAGKTISITGNTAGTAVGGVNSVGELHLSGKVIIKDNICENIYDSVNYPVNLAVKNSKLITIDGALTGSEIYVTEEDGDNKHCTGILTSGFTTKNEGAKVDDFFHYDGPSNYYLDLNTDGDSVGELEVKEIPSASTDVAQIGTTKYATLADAVAEAQNDDTITLQTNNSETITINKVIAFKIDANGNSFTPANITAGTGYVCIKETDNDVTSYKFRISVSFDSEAEPVNGGEAITYGTSYEVTAPTVSVGGDALVPQPAMTYTYYKNTGSDSTPVWTIINPDVKPTDAGSYKVVIAVKDDNATYSGSEEYIFSIAKADVEAPAAGVGCTINYAEEKIAVESGYEISKSNDPFAAETLTDSKLDIEPGVTYYIRKAADDNHKVSASASFTLDARQAIPENAPALVSKTDTTIIISAAAGQEYSIDNGATWVSDGGTGDSDSTTGTITFNGLTKETEYSIITRTQATSTAFASLNTPASVITTKSDTQSAAAAEAIDVVNGEIKSGDTVVEVKGADGEDVASENLAVVAEKINEILDNDKVNNFDETGIEAATEAKKNKIADALKSKTDDTVAKDAVSDTGISKYLNVTLVSADVDINTTVVTTVTVKKLVFDVTPMATITVTGSDGELTLTTEITNDEINDDVTFLLPVDSANTAETAAVYHEDEFLGNYPVKKDGDDKYIEVTTDSFSEFGYITLDETTAGAKIGDTLYASLSDAVSRVQNDETITLLKNASGTITVSRTVKFTVDDNGKTNSAEIVAGSGYVLSRSGNTYTFFVYSDDDAVYTKTDKMLKYFGDVPSNRYFYEPVLWAAKEGIAFGVDENSFDPFGLATRAQMVTFIWRAVGCPEPAATICKFNDLVVDEYYYKPVLWALENGIVKGTSETTFSPDENVTRGQAVAFLARLSNVKDEDAGYSHEFTDVSKEDYFYNAVAWAAKKKITNGTGETTFSPNEDCQRGEIVTFMYRFFVK